MFAITARGRSSPSSDASAAEKARRSCPSQAATAHPNARPTLNKTQWSGGLPRNVWIGYKYVVYDLPNGNVKAELYLDQTDGQNGGTWVKINELEDNGANFGTGGVPCQSGMNPAMRLLGTGSRPGSESGKPNM